MTIKTNYKRKVGLGADLSDVMNESFKPEKDFNKIQNSIFSSKQRINAFINTKDIDKQSKRYIKISSTNNFLKSYEDQSTKYNKLRNSTEDIQKLDSPTIESKPNIPVRYEFGLEYIKLYKKNPHQDEYLEKVSRKKMIGPHHNSMSTNFILSSNPTKQLSRNGNNILKRNSVDWLYLN